MLWKSLANSLDEMPSFRELYFGPLFDDAGNAE